MAEPAAGAKMPAIMTATLIRGAPLAATIEDDVRARAAALAARGATVRLAAVRANADPASDLYLKRQQDAAVRLGLAYVVVDCAPERAALERELDRLAADRSITGVIVQTPLPPGCDAGDVQRRIPPAKDVEGVHPLNLGRLLDPDPPLVPCTPAAVMECLKAAGVALAGKEAAVLGRSRTVGRPAALLLAEASATVTLCHSRTRDLAGAVRRADVVVCAVGRPGLVTAEMVKPGAAVI
ncbi:MAG TPA: bifunctional 5,10-methylenetetrahydrofolate dehydrogenase/5,10-methenyltetrahydrofolate cyclohydrolase, partial [Planctomycetota bacterium]|nr:bifunctional 5,10-methylenetetrahydrofolate dehydrogenase/5,10-methenyltetrahydrofolate cyclohydrolase [Planctomycetota bacterium]